MCTLLYLHAFKPRVALLPSNPYSLLSCSMSFINTGMHYTHQTKSYTLWITVTTVAKNLRTFFKEFLSSKIKLYHVAAPLSIYPSGTSGTDRIVCATTMPPINQSLALVILPNPILLHYWFFSHRLGSVWISKLHFMSAVVFLIGWVKWDNTFCSVIIRFCNSLTFKEYNQSILIVQKKCARSQCGKKIPISIIESKKMWGYFLATHILNEWDQPH